MITLLVFHKSDYLHAVNTTGVVVSIPSRMALPTLSALAATFIGNAQRQCKHRASVDGSDDAVVPETSTGIGGHALRFNLVPQSARALGIRGHTGHDAR